MTMHAAKGLEFDVVFVPGGQSLTSQGGCHPEGRGRWGATPSHAWVLQLVLSWVLSAELVLGAELVPNWY